MSATFASLRVPNYRIWFAAALVANIGTWMQRIGQDWLVLTELTDNSGTAMGVVTALQFVPFLAVSPFAGVLADRLPRRRLLMATQSALGLLGLTLGLLTLGGHIRLWQVYVLALGLGTVTAIDNPVRQTFVGDLVGTKLLPNAVGLNSASFNAARMIGPGVAGALIAWVGPGWVFVVTGVCFSATVVALGLMNSSRLVPQETARGSGAGLLAALRYVRGRPDIMLIMVVIAFASIFGLNFQIVNALMARVEFGMGAGEFGLVASVMAIGSLGGALLAARRERPRMALVVGAGCAFALALGLASLAPSYVLYILATIPMGFAALTMLTAANATLQTTTPRELRGRVMALYMMVFQGVTPLGAPLIGRVGELFGPRWSLRLGALAVGLVCVCAGLWARHHWHLHFKPHHAFPYLEIVPASHPYGAATAESG